MSIYDMTSTPSKREALEQLTDSEKLALIYKLTDSQNIIDLLEYIDQAEDDSKYCFMYR